MCTTQMATEMRLGHEIAEEEVVRVQEYSQHQVEERDERYLKCVCVCWVLAVLAVSAV